MLQHTEHSVLTVSADIAERLAAVRRKVLRRTFWRIKVNENWSKRYNEELMQLFKRFRHNSYVRTSRLKWIGHVNRMDSKRKASQVFNNNS